MKQKEIKTKEVHTTLELDLDTYNTLSEELGKAKAINAFIDHAGTSDNAVDNEHLQIMSSLLGDSLNKIEEIFRNAETKGNIPEIKAA